MVYELFPSPRLFFDIICTRYLLSLRWGEVVCQQFNFDRDVVETEVLKTLTLEDVRQFYRDFIAVDAPKRRKMATLVSPVAENQPEKDSGSKVLQSDRDII